MASEPQERRAVGGAQALARLVTSIATLTALYGASWAEARRLTPFVVRQVFRLRLERRPTGHVDLEDLSRGSGVSGAHLRQQVMFVAVGPCEWVRFRMHLTTSLYLYRRVGQNFDLR